jgi:hypothetical protein
MTSAVRVVGIYLLYIFLTADVYLLYKLPPSLLKCEGPFCLFCQFQNLLEFLERFYTYFSVLRYISILYSYTYTDMNNVKVPFRREIVLFVPYCSLLQLVHICFTQLLREYLLLLVESRATRNVACNIARMHIYA